jgi:hypothetical protein
LVKNLIIWSASIFNFFRRKICVEAAKALFSLTLIFMKIHYARPLLACLIAGLFSCKSFQVIETRTTANTPNIGIEWSHGERVDERLTRRIDSIMLKTMADFNAQPHAFKVHKKEHKRCSTIGTKNP